MQLYVAISDFHFQKAVWNDQLILDYISCSLWDYTNIVMNFLCASRTMDGGNKCNFDWLQYFDVVITGRSSFT